MSFSKVIRDRIRASKNVLLGVGLFTTLGGPTHPDDEVLAKLNELPAQYATLLMPLSANPLENMEILAEFGALSIANTELVAELNAPHVPDAALLSEPHQPLVPQNQFEVVVVATSVHRQFDVLLDEVVERRDHFTISRTELAWLQILLPAFALQLSQSSGPLIELEISSHTLFVLLRWIRGEYLGVIFRDYKPAALEKIRLEAETLACNALVKEIEKFEDRFKS